MFSHRIKHSGKVTLQNELQSLILVGLRWWSASYSADSGCLQAVSVRWSGLRLPWLELDWFIDLSSRITQLDLSYNGLSTLPSMLPWGLIHLLRLDLSNNQLKELPTARSSQEIICTQ